MCYLRDAFRAGDVWLARSRRYDDIRKALLAAPAVADADRSLPVPASPHDWLAERRSALDEGLRRLAAAARAGESTGESIEDSVLRVERTETAVPDGAADLVADLYRRLPEARAASRAQTSPGSTRFSPGCWKWTLNPRSFSTSMSRSASRIERLRASSQR